MNDLTHRADAIVFDLDGLMVNTEQLYDEVGDQLLRQRGKRFTSDLKDAMMGRPGQTALQIMIDWHGLDDDVHDLQSQSEEIFSQILPTRLATMPGLLDLLQAVVDADVPRAIATSSRREYVERTLEILKIDTRFEFVLTAEDVRCGKPDPEIYETAARKLGLSPNEMLVLEDSETGCRAAVAAGALTVAVPGSHSRHHNFGGVTLVADSLWDSRIYQLLGLPSPPA